MTILEHSVVIQATTDEIDAVTLNGNRFPEWYEGVKSAMPDNTYPEPGGVVDVTYKTAGVTFKMTMTSLQIAYGESLLLKMDGMITGQSHWVYTPADDGTRVTCTFEYEMPGGGFGQVLNKLMVERMNGENLERSLNNLKRVVETD